MKNEKIQKHCVSFSYLVVILIGLVLGGIRYLQMYDTLPPFLFSLVLAVFIGVWFIHPWVILFLNICFLVQKNIPQVIKKAVFLVIAAVIEGGLYILMLLCIADILQQNWIEVFYKTPRNLWIGVLYPIVFVANYVLFVIILKKRGSK